MLNWHRFVSLSKKYFVVYYNDILPADFPTSNTYGAIPENAWTSNEGGVIYRLLEDDGGNYKKLMCEGKPSGGDSVDLSKTVTLVSGDSEEYTYTDDSSGVLSVKFLFHLDNGKLTYIDVSLIGEDEKLKNLVGTYTPPAAPEPTIKIETNKTEYKIGEVIDITVTIAGMPFFTIIWIEDGVLIDRQMPIDSTGKGAFRDESKSEAGTYTYKAYVKEKQDIYDEVTVTVKGNDPKPDPTPSSDDSEPLFTGTTNSPVSNGAWKQDANGVWSYTTSQVFRNTWGYIVNPFAKEGQHQADWFYFDQYGHMLTGWQQVGGKWYYLNPTKDGTLGACLLGPGKTPDGWEIDETGAWTGK